MIYTQLAKKPLPMTPQELPEGIAAHGEETPGQDDLHVLDGEIEGVVLRTQTAHHAFDLARRYLSGLPYGENLF